MDVGAEHDIELQAEEEGESEFYTAGSGTGSILPVLFSNQNNSPILKERKSQA